MKGWIAFKRWEHERRMELAQREIERLRKVERERERERERETVCVFVCLHVCVA